MIAPSFFSLPAPLILGSQSPRRSQLLAALGIPFEVIVRNTDESILPGMSPTEAVLHIAEQKAAVFQDKIQENIVITADTIVVLGDTIIGKPKDEADAVRMLKALSKNQHTVHTAVCILYKDKKISFVESTNVFFRELREAEIRHYIQTYQPYDKAGAYGVQEWIGMTAITHIQGDFYNVMGLPVSKLYLHLSNM
jgi:septum formation protein